MATRSMRDPWLLRHQITDVLHFHHPNAIDHRYGGYVLQRDETDGHVYDTRSRHLVATARMTFVYCVGELIDGPHWCRSGAEHGLAFLRAAHWDEERGGFHWLLEGREPVDRERHCYGHVFALFAVAAAARIGLHGAESELERIVDVLESRFRDGDEPLYLDRCSPSWEHRPDRGQNANMHACEAVLMAYDATGRDRYLDRAAAIADAVTDTLAGRTGGLVWEHYTPAWEPDWDAREDGGGFEPGHQVEWAKLICQLHTRRENHDRIEKARELFDAAVGAGWDDDHGGFYERLDRDRQPVRRSKVGWAVAEAIGAAALLAEHDAEYWSWYDRCWTYAREALVDDRYGIWYQRVDRENERIEPGQGPCFEPGYHPVNNAWIALNAIAED